MSKLRKKDLALALHESTDGKDKKSVTKSIGNLVKMLVQNNILSDSDEIIRKYIQVYNKDKHIVDATVFSTISLDENQIEQIKKVIKKQLLVSEVEVTNIIDKELIGGLRIQVEDLVMDASIHTQLKQLEQHLIKHT